MLPLYFWARRVQVTSGEVQDTIQEVDTLTRPELLIPNDNIFFHLPSEKAGTLSFVALNGEGWTLLNITALQGAGSAMQLGTAARPDPAQAEWKSTLDVPWHMRSTQPFELLRKAGTWTPHWSGPGFPELMLCTDDGDYLHLQHRLQNGQMLAELHLMRNDQSPQQHLFAAHQIVLITRVLSGHLSERTLSDLNGDCLKVRAGELSSGKVSSHIQLTPSRLQRLRQFLLCPQLPCVTL